MRTIVSLRGKIYELRELAVGEIASISASNGYDIPEHFIDRFENWSADIDAQEIVKRCLPVRPPRIRIKPLIEPIVSTPKRGRPRKDRGISTTKMSSTSKKRRKRRSKYGFEKIRIKGDSIFVQAEAYRVAAAAAYFGSKYKPARKYSVHKARFGEIVGSRIKWVE